MIGLGDLGPAKSDRGQRFFLLFQLHSQNFRLKSEVLILIKKISFHKVKSNLEVRKKEDRKDGRRKVFWLNLDILRESFRKVLTIQGLGVWLSFRIHLVCIGRSAHIFFSDLHLIENKRVLGKVHLSFLFSTESLQQSLDTYQKITSFYFQTQSLVVQIKSF